LDIVFEEAEEVTPPRPQIWGQRYALADRCIAEHQMPEGGPLRIDGFWQAEGEDGLRCRAVQDGRDGPDQGYGFEVHFHRDTAEVRKVTCHDRKGRLVGTPAKLDSP